MKRIKSFKLFESENRGLTFRESFGELIDFEFIDQVIERAQEFIDEGLQLNINVEYDLPSQKWQDIRNQDGLEFGPRTLIYEIGLDKENIDSKSRATDGDWFDEASGFLKDTTQILPIEKNSIVYRFYVIKRESKRGEYPIKFIIDKGKTAELKEIMKSSFPELARRIK
jgi:hypothetical protein